MRGDCYAKCDHGAWNRHILDSVFYVGKVTAVVVFVDDLLQLDDRDDTCFNRIRRGKHTIASAFIFVGIHIR